LKITGKRIQPQALKPEAAILERIKDLRTLRELYSLVSILTASLEVVLLLAKRIC
jgi:hypothetical protein